MFCEGATWCQPCTVCDGDATTSGPCSEPGSVSSEIFCTCNAGFDGDGRYCQPSCRAGFALSAGKYRALFCPFLLRTRSGAMFRIIIALISYYTQFLIAVIAKNCFLQVLSKPCSILMPLDQELRCPINASHTLGAYCMCEGLGPVSMLVDKNESLSRVNLIYNYSYQ